MQEREEGAAGIFALEVAVAEGVVGAGEQFGVFGLEPSR